MSVYIVLFRGVGGATQLPTKPLAAALEAAGFRSVKTYIASGNVVLATERDASEVRDSVAAIARRDFGFAKHIMVADRSDWSRLIAANPFPQASGTALHGFLLEKKPDMARVAALEALSNETERVAFRDGFLYFHAPEGFGRAKLPPIIDRTLGVATTARNWNTVLKLRDLAAAVAEADGWT
ncbi:MAG: DUF1697 domain-containing protein [Rhizobiaceae bacterium]|nr:DUF1697 domain-containing protein [Rhizobiaceae bacterium]